MVRSRRGPNRARRGGGARGHDDVVDAGLARGEADGAPAPAKVSASIAKVLTQLARKQKDLTDLHNVRIRQTAHGLFVHYHCRFAGDRSVDHVHAAVDHIENGLQDRFPDIRRVIAHAEPIGRARHRL